MDVASYLFTVKVWSSLSSDVMEQIIDPAQSDPDWLRDEIKPWDRAEFRSAVEHELTVMRDEAAEFVSEGPPECGADYTVTTTEYVIHDSDDRAQNTSSVSGGVEAE